MFIIALSFVLLLVAAVRPASAQDPLTHYSDAFEMQFDRTQPIVRYIVRVDSADLSGFTVEMRIRNAGDTVHLALPIWAPGAYRVANFARNVRDLTVRSGAHDVPVAREDSSTWRAAIGGGEATVRYRVAFPTPAAAASANNRSFLRETGALVDGPATYLYLVGHKLIPSHVAFDIPAGWRIATGLRPTSDSTVFFAPSYDVLIDSPVLLGALHIWPFEVDGVPYRAAYWPTPDAAAFDTAAFVASVERVVREEVAIFGRPPYRDYTFLFIDGAGGGLEHLNSTSIGAPSTTLARDPTARAGTVAHEFFHAWNVKRIRPAVLGPFDYQHEVHTTGLWFSEGVTSYFGDAMLRRTGLMSEREARESLAGNIASYLGNPAHTRISPERSSWTAWNTPEVNGGYSISYYLQGQLLGELLDIAIRDSTGMRRGMDDVIRAMFDRYAAARGFTGEDIVHTVNDVCECDLQPFFERYVSGAEEIDFAPYLAELGFRLVVTRHRATDDAGRPLPDRRVGVIGFAGTGSAGGAAGERPKLSVSDPTSAWGRAGLRTGDQVISVNGKAIADAGDFRAALAPVRIGDRVRVDYLRDGERRRADVVVTGYEVVEVALEELPRLSAHQRAMRQAWLSGTAR